MISAEQFISTWLAHRPISCWRILKTAWANFRKPICPERSNVIRTGFVSIQFVWMRFCVMNVCGNLGLSCVRPVRGGKTLYEAAKQTRVDAPEIRWSLGLGLLENAPSEELSETGRTSEGSRFS